MTLDIDTSSLSTRSRAHPFDFPVNLPSKTRGVDASPNAIGGFYGIGWDQFYRDYKTGEVYAVPCSDGVNGGNSAHSDRDLGWMKQMREHIIARTMSVRRGIIRISQHEWAIMLGFTFGLWFDELPGEEFKTTGDKNRHLEEGLVGTINGLQVMVGADTPDDLPPVGDFRGYSPDVLPSGLTKSGPVHEPTRFSGVFAAALEAAIKRAQAA